MTAHVNHVCKQHPDPFDCADHLIFYAPRFDEYGIIIHDGGTSMISIHYCPWCGVRLPESRRDAWFDALETLGYDDPADQDIPMAFQTDAWYRNPLA